MFPCFFPYGSHPKISRSIPKFQRKRWVALNLWGNHHEFPVELCFLRICFGYIHVYPIISHLEAQPCIFIVSCSQHRCPFRKHRLDAAQEVASWAKVATKNSARDRAGRWFFGCSDAATIGILSYFMFMFFCHQDGIRWGLYPLVNVYITMERSTIFDGKIHYKWPFSIARLNYQRVNMIKLQQSRDRTGWWRLMETQQTGNVSNEKISGWKHKEKSSPMTDPWCWYINGVPWIPSIYPQ